MSEFDNDLQAVLESAPRLHELVPDAALVPSSVAAMYMGHRASYDHDHVVADLRDRFDAVLEALEREGEWVTNRTTPGKIILGQIGEIEVGVRQLIRTTPLETQTFMLRSGRTLRVPTAAETLRVKAFLIVKRNQVRDYLDVTALSERYGVGPSAAVLADIDSYYADQTRGQAPERRAVSGQLVAQLADPRPKDSRVTKHLSSYKALASRWHSWASVVATCQNIATHMLDRDWSDLRGRADRFLPRPQEPPCTCTVGTQGNENTGRSQSAQPQMALRFRNLTVDPTDPVEQWGVEGLLTAIERGQLNDWQRINRAIR